MKIGDATCRKATKWTNKREKKLAGERRNVGRTKERKQRNVCE
jgi:hypothetical protein